MRTVLFAPGFKESMKSRDYKETIAAIENSGYKVKFIAIDWQRTTLNEWSNQLSKEYGKYKPDDVILAGFSFGSMTAFMASVSFNPSELWLFSFSPYFSEDMPKMKKSWLAYIGHRRADVFRQISFNKLSKSIKCKTLIFVGDKEVKKYPLIGSRAKVAKSLILNSQLIIVPDCGHDVTNPNYIKAIKDAIS